MATLRKRGNSWVLDYRVNGRRYRETLGPNDRLAEIRLGEVKAQIERNQAGFPDENYTVEEIMERYLEAAKVNNAPRTYVRHTNCRDHWVRFLEDNRIEMAKDLRPHDLEKYKGQRQEDGVKSRTINREVAFLKSCYLYATGDNPFRRVKALKVKDGKVPRWLTKEEFKRLIAKAKSEHADYFIAFALTGARRAELTSLTWKDIDFKGEEIRLTNFKNYDDTRNKYRRVPMHPRLRKILERRKEKKGLKVPFPAPASHNTIRRWMLEAARKAGIKGISGGHDLRHTCGSWLAQGGASEKYIRDWLGHRDLRSTAIYTHLMPRDLR